MTHPSKISQFISQTTWADVPETVRKKVIMCFVDSLGATLAGTQTPVSDICTDFSASLLPGNEATLFLKKRKTSALGAALANGAAANGVDADDSARYAWGHAGAQIFPTAFAMAESLGKSGQALLTAMVVGYEIAHRMGGCWHEDHAVYQACGSWGTVACAATAANLLGLSSEQCHHALGIADYHAPNAPMMRDVAHPAMVKHGIPWACFSGISSAQLAKRGFTGIPSLLEDPRYEHWIMEIGEKYILPEGVSWKQKGFACCGWTHPAAKGAGELMTTHRFSLSDISRIEVETFEEATQLYIGLPNNTEEAQFNIAWPLAAMLVDGEVGPRQTSRTRLNDPIIRDIAQKVEIRINPEYDALCQLHAKGDPKGGFFGRVTIDLTDGTKLISGVHEAGLSFNDQGWDQKRMTEKFKWLTDDLMPEEQMKALLEIAWKIEGLPTVDGLIALIQ